MKPFGHQSEGYIISSPCLSEAAYTCRANTVHLISILSKTVERTIGQPLVAFLEARGYGNAQ